MLSLKSPDPLAYREVVPKIIDLATTECERFKGGRIRRYFSEWHNLTADTEILQTVRGYLIEFTSMPIQRKIPKEISFNNEQLVIVQTEIDTLLRKGVIVKCDREPGDFISKIFVRQKKDGSFRMILNLTQLNTHIAYHHFKMDSLHTAIQMMTESCYMCSVDIKDAYYSCAIHESHQKYLKFCFKDQLYKYVVFPNGLAPLPRVFTKLLKPAYASLRRNGNQSVAFIDDSYLQGATFHDCQNNVIATVSQFTRLGFIIHPEKSQLWPSQQLVFLGFLLDSILMCVKLTSEKHTKLRKLCTKFKKSTQPTIREVSKVLGFLISILPAVQHGRLFTRNIENDKIQALKQNHGDYDALMTLSQSSLKDLDWWHSRNIEHGNPIRIPQPSVVIKSDSSKKGWGCVCETTDVTSQGLWSCDEKQKHINYLELKAAKIALVSLASQFRDTHVRIYLDNVCAVAYIREYSLECNELARDIWVWALDRNIRLSACHIPGTKNIVADKQSRKFREEMEYKLNPDLFQKVIRHFDFTPDIDLFASRINNQLSPYISWQPDPGASFIDAFSVSWETYHFYAFPPFCSHSSRATKNNSG